MLERIAELVNQDEWLLRKGRHLDTVFIVDASDSRWRVTNIRVRAQVVDAAGATVRESVVSVFGNSVPGARTFFVLPPIAEGHSYELTVVSFDLVSQEGP